MGVFKDLHELTKQTEEIRKAHELEGSRTESIADMEGTAQVLAVGQSTGSLNSNPILPVKLLVDLPGQPLRPMTPTLVIPTGQLPRVIPGATLSVTISAANPETVAINWRASF